MNSENVADNSGKDMEQDEEMGLKYSDIDLFPADKLINKMGNNMATAEALTDERPLWTEKTAELERDE